MTTTTHDSLTPVFRVPSKNLSMSRFLAEGRAVEAVAETTPAATPESFRVCEDLQPASVDRVSGILRGVRVCGLVSKNGRRYKAEALRNAVPLYEGSAVNVNHENDSGPRSYTSRFGVLRNVRFVENDGLRGDLMFPVNHILAEQICFDAEHRAPVGLSHDVDAKTSRGSDGVVTIESVNKVRSVDIVSSPATNRTFFESALPHQRTALGRILEGPPAIESRTFAAVKRLNRDSLSRFF